MIKVQVAEDFFNDGIVVRVLMEGDGSRMILRIGENDVTQWVPFEPGLSAEPYLTVRLPEDAGRALLDALLRHYEGASDMHTVRSDLLHERGRVDKLTDSLIRLVDRTGP